MLTVDWGEIVKTSHVLKCLVIYATGENFKAPRISYVNHVRIFLSFLVVIISGYTQMSGNHVLK